MKVKVEIEIEAISNISPVINEIFDTLKSKLDTFEVVSFKPTVTIVEEHLYPTRKEL